MHSQLHLSSFQYFLLLWTLAYSLYLHLHVSCYSICLVSLVVDIRLNTLKFKFLATSKIHNLSYGLLIFLQLLLHFLVLILKGKNTCLFLLKLTTCGISLHFWLFIGIQLSEVALNKFMVVKVNENANPVKKAILINQTKHFIILSHSFLLNNCECLTYHQLQ